MKKKLLSVAAVVFAAVGFGQVLPADYAQLPIPQELNDSVNLLYSTNGSLLTKRSGLHVIDTAISWNSSSTSNVYECSYNLEKQLEVVFKRSEIPNQNYEDFHCYWTKWKNTPTGLPEYPFSYSVTGTTNVPEITDVSSTQDLLTGVSVDLYDNPVVRVTVRSTEKTNVRVDLFDKNGRMSNAFAPHHWINTPNKDTVLEFRWDYRPKDGNGTINYKYEEPKTDNYNVGIAADGWRSEWWGINNGRYLKNALIFNGRTGLNAAILLDMHNIVGIAITIDDGSITADHSLNTSPKTITLKDISVGEAQLSPPSAIEGKSSVCFNSTEVYKWRKVQNAESYKVSYTGTGATNVVTDTTASITFAANATPGEIQVIAQSSKLSESAASKLAITINGKPTAPTITGEATVCPNTIQQYTSSLTVGEKLKWTVANSMTIDGANNLAGVNVKIADTATKAFITATLSNTCGNAEATKQLSITPLPVLSGTITGKDTVCKNAQETFSLSGTNSFTNYVWKKETTELTETSSSVKLDFAASNVNLSVQVKNECGLSNVIKKTIVVQTAHREPIGLVTFSQDGKSMIVAWEHTRNVGTKKYTLMRETTSMGIWEPIQTVLYEKAGLYTDSDVNISKRRYRYKLVTYSSCGDTAESAPHRNMLLQPSSTVGSNQVNLNWAPYEGLEVKTYFVYRILQNGTEQEAATVAGNETMAYDNEPVANSRYRIAFKLLQDVDPLFYHFKSDTGPFSQSLSNMSEAALVRESSLTDGTISITPTTATTTVAVNGLTDEYSISVIDLLGKPANVAIKESVIDVAGLAAGVYFVNVQHGQKLQSFKFVKQ